MIYCNKIKRSHYRGWSAILSWMDAYIRKVFRFRTYKIPSSIARVCNIRLTGATFARISRGPRYATYLAYGTARGGGTRTLAIFSTLSDDDPCLVKYCGAGRECEVSADGEEIVAACVCVRRCARRHRPVCASNGRVYVNHCEMHRAACNADTPLTIRRLSRCLSNGEHVLDTVSLAYVAQEGNLFERGRIHTYLEYFRF